MPDTADQHHSSAARHPEHVAAPVDRATALEALRHGPRGAVALSALAVGVVMLIWVLFYLLVFLPRGPVG